MLREECGGGGKERPVARKAGTKDSKMRAGKKNSVLLFFSKRQRKERENRDINFMFFFFEEDNQVSECVS